MTTVIWRFSVRFRKTGNNFRIVSSSQIKCKRPLAACRNALLYGWAKLCQYHLIERKSVAPRAWQNVSTIVADANGAWPFTESNDISTRFIVRMLAKTHRLFDPAVFIDHGGQAYRRASRPDSGATGVQDLYLKFTGGTGSLFNVDYWKFE